MGDFEWGFGETNAYPLVDVYVTMERSTMLLMGKLTMSMATFNSYVKLRYGKEKLIELGKHGKCAVLKLKNW